MTPAEVAAVYERAAGEIERRGGIHKGEYGDDPEHPDTCRVCLLGAVKAVAHGDPFTENLLPHELLNPLVAVLGFSIAEWNDAPGTTTDDVTRLLRSLAQQLAEGGTA